MSGLAALLSAAVVAPWSPVRAATIHVVPVAPDPVEDLAALRMLYIDGPSEAGIQNADPTADARCGAPAANPVPDDVPIVVSMPPAASFTVGAIPATSWRNPPVSDPTWRMNYTGLMWMRPLARRAAIDGHLKSLDALVQQAVLFHRQNPDPGNSLYGWDEGTALRRLEAENCLYALTKSPALVPGMNADVRVLLGSRYYGPPYAPVHNHGLMANLQLLRAGELLNRSDWTGAATRRMAAEAPLAFSKIGFSYEQSSAYQLTNATLWQQAAQELARFPEHGMAARALRATVARAFWVFSFLTEPDGYIVQVGDADKIAGRPADLKGNRAVRDDQAGWVVGRWGWTDPNVPFYTVRYGPPRRAHGREDRAGGVTWSIKGARVLVGVGRYSYDINNRYARYQIRPDSPNVAMPVGGAVKGGVSKLTSTFGATSHVLVVQDTVYGVGHTRRIQADSNLPRMVVSDAFGSVKTWRQHWHLDPAWKLASGQVGGNKLVFSHPSGRKLTVATTGKVVSMLRGNTSGPYGWTFPRFQTMVPSYQLMFDNVGGKAITTTFWVS